MIDEKIARIANISTIIGTIIAIFSVNINIAISIMIIVMIFIIRVLYVFYHKYIVIENKKIDLVELIKPTIKNDYTLMPSLIHHTCIIEGERGSFEYEYQGFCISPKGENSIVFNIGAEESIPFDDLVCFAYDLQNDQERQVKIIPTLVGDDGLIKKIKIDFLCRLNFGSAFHVVLFYSFPHCMKYGKDYFNSSISYYNKKIDKVINTIIFKQEKPEYVKVYKIKFNRNRYEKTLIANLESNDKEFIYDDIRENCQGNLMLIYFFNRKR